MLNDLTVLSEQIVLDKISLRYQVELQIPDDRLYCPGCSDYRLVSVQVWVGTGTLLRLSRRHPKAKSNVFDPEEWEPSLLSFKCEQCDMRFSVIIYDGSEGPALAIFPNDSGGLSTHHTPDEVKHFVDEAYKCHSVGANGAAVAMFRVALEQLLHEQGYTEGMLHEKIIALETDIEAGKGNDWAIYLDTEILSVIKKLGNVVAHPKDIASLTALDNEAVVGVQETFHFLLHEIYEKPYIEQNFLNSLNQIKEGTS